MWAAGISNIYHSRLYFAARAFPLLHYVRIMRVRGLWAICPLSLELIQQWDLDDRNVARLVEG
jgi:hypothetical protein